MTVLPNHAFFDRNRHGYGRGSPVSVWTFSAVHEGRRVVSFPPFVIMGNSLTVTEKTHWKDRITKRIDKQIDVLCSENPEFIERTKQAAREKALESLGVDDLQRSLDRIEHQEELLEAREEKTYRQISAKLRGVRIRQVSESSYRIKEELSEAVSKRQAIHEQELLAETPRGREILTLRREKENLLDTVWLATSPKQIKDLWREVDDLLGDEQTKLQREALAIEPVEENC